MHRGPYKMSRSLGNGNLSHDAHKQIARLMQLHQQTHPQRIADRWKVTSERVRQIWTEMPREEQAELQDVLVILGINNP